MAFRLGIRWLWTFVMLSRVKGATHWPSSPQLALKIRAEFGSSAETLPFKRAKRADAPSWILDCEGLDCLYKILRVLTYRLPVNTVGLWDDIFETYNARDALKKQLQIQKINTMRAEHAASMASIVREIELLETEFELENTNIFIPTEVIIPGPRSHQVERKSTPTIKFFESSKSTNNGLISSNFGPSQQSPMTEHIHMP